MIDILTFMKIWMSGGIIGGVLGIHYYKQYLKEKKGDDKQ